MNCKLLSAIAILQACALNAASPGDSNTAIVTSIAASPNGGFWVQVQQLFTAAKTDATLTTGGAPAFDNVAARGNIAAIPGRNGYWVVSIWGDIYARGDAPMLCGGKLSNCSGYPAQPHAQDAIVSVAAKPDGQGFWALTTSKKVWTAGSARSYGDATTQHTYFPTSIVATPSGNGYYILQNDGGVFSFGDAKFFGSTGGKKPNGRDATGLALSLDADGSVNGYWMIGADGSVSTYGEAHFLGSTGGNPGSSIVTNITALPYGRGYAWVHADGRVETSQTMSRVTVTSKFTFRDLDVQNSSRSAGALLTQSSPNGNASQKWDLWPVHNDSTNVQMVNVNSRLCAEVAPDESRQVIQAPCAPVNAATSQTWKLIGNPDGSTTFRPAAAPGYAIGTQNDVEDEAVALLQQDALPNTIRKTWTTNFTAALPAGRFEACAVSSGENQ